jgi:serine/threonine-protein kinase
VNRVSRHWEELPASELVPLTADGIAMPFVEGDVIGEKYQIVRVIGTGGMGYVVSAIHLELNEAVALKFLRPEALKNEELVGRFAREAQVAAKIKSEHVARVFDVSRLPDGTPFIVMEHLEGKDLCDYVGERGPLPVKVAVDYVLQACEGLAAAHAIGIVHRDIKPENLFLAGRSQGIEVVKILDFGISKVALTGSAFTGSSELVRTTIPMGSPVYMSPEQIRDTESVDARTDIWSLGCVLMELLTGKSTFDAQSIMQLSAIIIEKDAPKLRTRLPDAPAELEDVVARCLHRDANKRFQSVAELAVALYHFGSRRARLSAERCCHLLQGNTDDFELPTLPPPTSNPGSAPASRILLSATGADASAAELANAPVGVSSSPAPGDRPPSMATPVPNEPAAKGSRAVLIVAVLLLAFGAGAYVALSQDGGQASGNGAKAPRDMQSSRAVDTRGAAPAAAEAPSEAPETVAEGAAAASAAEGHPKAPARRMKRPRAPVAPGKDKPRAVQGAEDVDVGF